MRTEAPFSSTLAWDLYFVESEGMRRLLVPGG